jgi:hypothetical protein
MSFRGTTEYRVRSGFICLALGVGCCSALYPIASSGETLGEAKLPKATKERIYQQLDKYLEGMTDSTRLVEQGYDLKLIQLAPNGREGVRVWGMSQDGGVSVCGATGNCPIWVFDSETGDLLLSAVGWELRVETTVHHGYYDMVTRQNMSAMSGIRDRYRFNGRAYKIWQETDKNYMR